MVVHQWEQNICYDDCVWVKLMSIPESKGLLIITLSMSVVCIWNTYSVSYCKANHQSGPEEVDNHTSLDVDDVMTRQYLLHYWPFAKGIRRSLTVSPHRRLLVLSFGFALLLPRTNWWTTMKWLIRDAMTPCGIPVTLNVGVQIWLHKCTTAYKNQQLEEMKKEKKE